MKLTFFLISLVSLQFWLSRPLRCPKAYHARGRSIHAGKLCSDIVVIENRERNPKFLPQPRVVKTLKLPIWPIAGGLLITIADFFKDKRVAEWLWSTLGSFDSLTTDSMFNKRFFRRTSCSYIILR